MATSRHGGFAAFGRSLKPEDFLIVTAQNTLKTPKIVYFYCPNSFTRFWGSKQFKGKLYITQLFTKTQRLGIFDRCWSVSPILIN